MTVIQRANSDLRLSPHLHTAFLDGVYAKDRDGKGQMFHPAPAPTQQEIEAIVGRASTRLGTGIFLVAFFLRRVRGTAVFVAEGLVVCTFLRTGVSFLWYNVIGCLAVLLVSVLLSYGRPLSTFR